MQNTGAAGSAVVNQTIDYVSVGKRKAAPFAPLTSKLHLLVAFNQFLGDDEITQAYLTYIHCGACMIELGVVPSSCVARSAPRIAA
jgi:hypothetical protein